MRADPPPRIGGMPLRRVHLPWLVAAALAVVAGRSLVPGLAGGAGAVPQDATVVRVVDGDTIVARLADGRFERVRYIGMDTPEDVKPGVPVQCFSLRAAAANRALVAGRGVRLVPGAEPRDRYGRLLAYVYRRADGLFVNAELVRRGFARTLTIPPNTRYAGRFAALADAARRAGRGLWGAC
jgi:micrococcal nuclease